MLFLFWILIEPTDAVDAIIELDGTLIDTANLSGTMGNVIEIDATLEEVIS